LRNRKDRDGEEVSKNLIFHSKIVNYWIISEN